MAKNHRTTQAECSRTVRSTSDNIIRATRADDIRGLLKTILSLTTLPPASSYNLYMPGTSAEIVTPLDQLLDQFQFKFYDLKNIPFVNWSDTSPFQGYVKNVMPFMRATRNQLACCGKYFLNLYVGNIMSRSEVKITYEPTVLMLWSGMKFKDMYLSSDVFHSSASTDRVDNCHWLKLANVSYMDLYKKPDGFATATWYDTLWNKLSDSSTPEFDLTVNYLGFLAMTLMRLLINGGQKVQAHVRNHSADDFKKCWGTRTRLEPCVQPHDRLIDALCNNNQLLYRNLNTCKILLAYLVESHITVSGEHASDIKNIFNTACLQTLAFNGMPCYTWIIKAAEVMNISAKELIDYMYEQRIYRHRLKPVRQFFEKYPQNPTEKSWPWARLFCDLYFHEIISMKHSYEIVVICAAIIHGSNPNDQIWQTPLFKDAKKKREFEDLLMRGRDFLLRFLFNLLFKLETEDVNKFRNLLQENNNLVRQIHREALNIYK